MSSVHQADHAEEVPPDVAAIVIRAGALGFSPTRVAIALGVSQRSLGSIDLAAAQAGIAPATIDHPRRSGQGHAL